MVKRVVVVGGGSAGFLAAITLKARARDLSVTVIRSKEIGIIGVGEGSTAVLPAHLHGYLGIDYREFLRLAPNHERAEEVRRLLQDYEDQRTKQK